MYSTNDEKKLKLCLTRIINAVSQGLENGQTLAKKRDLSDNPGNDRINANLNTITLDEREIDLLEQVAEDVKDALDECLPYVTSICASILTDYLHPYNYNREREDFSRPLTKPMLYSIQREFKGLLGKSF